MCLDGVGEWATTSMWIGDGHQLTPQWEIDFPHSLGLLYSAFTYYTGFRVNSGEYKLMGLAPYGEPKYVDLILDNLIDLKEDGTFRLNMKLLREGPFKGIWIQPAAGDAGGANWPFAPVVKFDKVSEWFEHEGPSPYMLIVAPVKEDKRNLMSAEQEKLFGIDKLNIPRSQIPAVTHVDYSARVQTVHPETNPRFYHLLDAFEEKTGCPVLVNTSFNVRGEPIVIHLKMRIDVLCVLKWTTWLWKIF
ncbi:hypothetical protein GQR58_023600 [Nymphon striatum]|nr:hypothetical protein GQR58_023600 [Nymphon striatum]